MYATVLFPVDVNLLFTDLLPSGMRSPTIMPRSSNMERIEPSILEIRSSAIFPQTLSSLEGWQGYPSNLPSKEVALPGSGSG